MSTPRNNLYLVNPVEPDSRVDDRMIDDDDSELIRGSEESKFLSKASIKLIGDTAARIFEAATKTVSTQDAEPFDSLYVVTSPDRPAILTAGELAYALHRIIGDRTLDVINGNSTELLSERSAIQLDPHDRQTDDEEHKEQRKRRIEELETILVSSHPTETTGFIVIAHKPIIRGLAMAHYVSPDLDPAGLTTTHMGPVTPTPAVS